MAPLCIAAEPIFISPLDLAPLDADIDISEEADCAIDCATGCTAGMFTVGVVGWEICEEA